MHLLILLITLYTFPFSFSDVYLNTGQVTGGVQRSLHHHGDQGSSKNTQQFMKEWAQNNIIIEMYKIESYSLATSQLFRAIMGAIV